MLEKSKGSSLSIREEEFGSVIHNPINDAIYECNKSAAHIIKLLDGTNTVDAIADEIAAEFEINADIAKKDISEFIDKYIYKL